MKINQIHYKEVQQLNRYNKSSKLKEVFNKLPDKIDIRLTMQVLDWLEISSI